MAGIQNHRTILDRWSGYGAVCPDHLEAPMKHPLEGKKVLVVGMARSGLAAVELLLRHGALVQATDERDAQSLGASAERLKELSIALLPQTVDTFTAADLVVLSPGIPTDIAPVSAARERGIPVIGEVELASYFLQGPVIGVTGSNGKTTTTAMIGHILREAAIPNQVGGNIGTAPTAMIESSQDDQWNVLELSSFQLETIEEFQAKIAVCLNVTPDHLDRHHSFENYAKAKGRLFDTLLPDGHAVLNADDSVCASFAEQTKGKVSWFSATKPTRQGLYQTDNTIICDGVPLIRIDELPLRGAHNVENAMAAALACRLAGASLQAIAAGIRSFPGVKHRLEFVRDRDGVQYFNDSKATNVDAAIKAVEAFTGNLWIILGGKDKDSNYVPLRDKLVGKEKAVLLIGAAAGKIASQLEGLNLVQLETLDCAVRYAAAHAVSGDVILLAPACASFDQFDNYEHRGNTFKQIVESL
jgi:UDP-N-acetylmuramoylalanine--D-glutamate ligase